jgi:SAM-dependent methyltransferase
LSSAEIAVAAWRSATQRDLGRLARFFIEQVGDLQQPKRVLLMGCGWGRDLLLLKHHYPTWDWVGYDHNAALVEAGRELLAEANLTAKSAKLGEAMPFADRSFDVVLSLGYFSSLYEPAAQALAKEILRVRNGPVFHLEDGRGAEQGLQLKSYSLKSVYGELGVESVVQPVLVDGSPIGMYLLKIGNPS